MSRENGISGVQILTIAKRIEDNFQLADWQTVGLLIDCKDIINNHDRLLRSLKFCDPDYSGCVLEVLGEIDERNPSAMKEVQELLDTRYPEQEGIYISDSPSVKKITFAPEVFSIPDGDVEDNLVAVMMPFAGFNDVYDSIKAACKQAGATLPTC